MAVKYYDKDKKKWVIFPGTVGAPGKDSYITALENGYKGSVEDYNYACAILPEMVDRVENADKTPIKDSANLITSDGVYLAINDLDDKRKEDDSIQNEKIGQIESESKSRDEELDNSIKELSIKHDEEVESIYGTVNENKTIFDNYVISNDENIEKISTTINEHINTYNEHIENSNNNINGITESIDELKDSIKDNKELIDSNKFNHDSYVESNNLAVKELSDSFEAFKTSIEEFIISEDNKIKDEVDDAKGEINESIGSLDESFRGEIDKVVNSLSEKANTSDVESTYATKDSVQSVLDAIDKIDTTVSADEVAVALSGMSESDKVKAAKTISDIINGHVKIEGTAIADGAIVAENIVSNFAAHTVLMAGDTISNRITSGLIKAENIEAGTITSKEISSDYVYAGDLKAEQITSGTISADVLDLSDYLTVGDAEDTYTTKETLEKTIEDWEVTIDGINNNIDNKTTLDNVIDALTNAPTGRTTINGGWIDTNAITVRSSNIVDDNNTPVTIITNDTLATTNIIANNLQVNAANIKNLTADKIAAGTLSGSTVKSSNNSWMLRNDGSGYLANKNIIWGTDGIMTVNASIITPSIELTGGDFTFKVDEANAKLCSLKNQSESAGIWFKQGKFYILTNSASYAPTTDWTELDTYIRTVVNKAYKENNYTETEYRTDYDIEIVDQAYSNGYFTVSPQAGSISLTCQLWKKECKRVYGMKLGEPFDNGWEIGDATQVTNATFSATGWDWSVNSSYLVYDLQNGRPYSVSIDAKINGNTVYTEIVGILYSGEDSSNY